jgi:hypothetical protein
MVINLAALLPGMVAALAALAVIKVAATAALAVVAQVDILEAVVGAVIVTAVPPLEQELAEVAVAAQETIHRL